MFEIPIYLTVAEVAKALRVSKMSVYRLIEADKIQHVKVERSFRISEESLATYLKEHTSGTSYN